jgi:hypothetical protein
MPLNSKTSLKAYSPPRLNKLTPEEAKLLLIGHATQGNQGAKDLLDLVYPDLKVEPSKVFRAARGGNR